MKLLNKFGRVLLGTAVFSSALLCSSGPVQNPQQANNQLVQQSNSDGFVETVGFGETAADADTEAKTLMLEQVVGSIVESDSSVADAQLQYYFVSRYTDGFVKNYQRLEIQNTAGGFRVKARGQVSQSAVGSALRERRREIGNPKMMILMNESMFGVNSRPGFTKTEIEFQAQMKTEGFEFIDEEQFKRFLAREKGLQSTIYGNPSAEETALKAAAELNTDILVIGMSKTTSAGEIRDSGLFSVKTEIMYKVVNVGTAGTMAASNQFAIASQIDQSLAATTAIKKATEKLVSEMKVQIGSDWQAGGTSRVVFSGISMGEFTGSDLYEIMNRLRGVTSVDPRGDQGSGPVVEVRCFCSTFQLSRNLARRSWESKYNIEVKDVRGSNAQIQVRRKP